MSGGVRTGLPRHQASGPLMNEMVRTASRTRNSDVFPIVGAVDATTDRTTR